MSAMPHSIGPTDGCTPQQRWKRLLRLFSDSSDSGLPWRPVLRLELLDTMKSFFLTTTATKMWNAETSDSFRAGAGPNTARVREETLKSLEQELHETMTSVAGVDASTSSGSPRSHYPSHSSSLNMSSAIQKLDRDASVMLDWRNKLISDLKASLDTERARLLLNLPSGHMMQELDEEEFIEKFGPFLATQRPTKRELRRWFRDIDVDLSNKVSWSELTDFILNSASTPGEQLDRTKQFIPVADPDAIHNADIASHKDVCRVIATHDKLSFTVSGAEDGLLKGWTPLNCANIFTINNSLNTGAKMIKRECSGGGAVLSSAIDGIIPITDVVFNPRGSHCFVAGLDCSVTVYEVKIVGDSPGLVLSRQYIGVPEDSTATIQFTSKRRAAAAGLIDTTVLLRMEDYATTIEVAVDAGGRELLYVGMQNGTVLAYPTLRLSRATEIQPALISTEHHKGFISKIRLVPALNLLISVGWDGCIVITEPNTLRKISTLSRGVPEGGRPKAILDFAYSKYFRILATVGHERVICLWNITINYPMAILSGHTAPLKSVTLNPEDHVLASLDTDATVRVWDLRSNRLIQTINTLLGTDTDACGSVGTDDKSGITRPPTQIAFHAPTSCIMVCGQRSLFYAAKRTQSSYPVTYIGHREPILCSAFMGATNTLVTVDRAIVMCWDILKGRRQMLWDCVGSPQGLDNDGFNENTSKDPLICAMTRDTTGKKILTVDDTGRVRVYNYRSGQLLQGFNPFQIHGKDDSNVTPLPDDDDAARTKSLSPPKPTASHPHESSQPQHLFQLSNGENTVHYSIIVYSRSLLSIEEGVPSGPEGGRPKKTVSLLSADDKKSNFDFYFDEKITCGCTFPAAGVVSCATLLLGTSAGRMFTFVPVSNSFTTKVVHPSPGEAEAASSALGGLLSSAAGAVEEVCYVAASDIVISLLGNRYLYCWDLNKLKLCYIFDAHVNVPRFLASALRGQTNMMASTCLLPDTLVREAAVGGAAVIAAGIVSIAVAMPALEDDEDEDLGIEEEVGKIRNKKKNTSTFIDIIIETPLVDDECANTAHNSTPKEKCKENQQWKAFMQFKEIKKRRLEERKKYIILGCDKGYVYVRDGAGLKALHDDKFKSRALSLPLLFCFSAFEVTTPIRDMSFSAEKSLLSVLGGAPSDGSPGGVAKLFSISGEFIGVFGQPQRWNTRLRYSFADPSLPVAADQRPAIWREQLALFPDEYQALLGQTAGSRRLSTPLGAQLPLADAARPLRRGSVRKTSARHVSPGIDGSFADGPAADTPPPGDGVNAFLTALPPSAALSRSHPVATMAITDAKALSPSRHDETFNMLELSKRIERRRRKASRRPLVADMTDLRQHKKHNRMKLLQRAFRKGSCASIARDSVHPLDSNEDEAKNSNAKDDKQRPFGAASSAGPDAGMDANALENVVIWAAGGGGARPSLTRAKVASLRASNAGRLMPLTLPPIPAPSIAMEIDALYKNRHNLSNTSATDDAGSSELRHRVHEAVRARSSITRPEGQSEWFTRISSKLLLQSIPSPKAPSKKLPIL